MTPKRYLTLLLAVTVLLLLCSHVSAIDYSISYNPETGTYTQYWFDPTAPPSLWAMIFSFLLPYTNIFGPSVYFVLWAAPIVALWLYTQDITMPWVVGTLTGTLLANAMATMPEGLYMMILVIGFAGGGILAKALLGRPS